MIYTLTLNPSIDYYISLDTLLIGGLNRSKAESARAGGKGINVSLMLKKLGVESTALGFTGGFTGEEIRRQIRNKGIKEEFIDVTGQCSRINIKVMTGCGAGSAGHINGVERSGGSGEAELNDAGHEAAASGVFQIMETQLNGRGITVSEADIELLYGKLDSLIPGDILIMSGAPCRGINENIYADIIDRLSSKGVKIILDTSGACLKKAAAKGPFLVKPNVDELMELYREEITADRMKAVEEGADIRQMIGVRREDIIRYAGMLKAAGARNVLVSMGADGAVLVADDGNIYEEPVPEIAYDRDISKRLTGSEEAGSSATDGGIVIHDISDIPTGSEEAGSSAKAGEAVTHGEYEDPMEASDMISTIGAGDSLVAGFTAEYFYGSGDYGVSLKKGVYAGTLTATGRGL